MNSGKGKDNDYPGIEALVRRAKVERATYLGDVISSGIVALTHGVGHAFSAVANAWRPKRRLAAR